MEVDTPPFPDIPDIYDVWMTLMFVIIHHFQLRALIGSSAEKKLPFLDHKVREESLIHISSKFVFFKITYEKQKGHEGLSGSTKRQILQIHLSLTAVSPDLDIAAINQTPERWNQTGACLSGTDAVPVQNSRSQ